MTVTHILKNCTILDFTHALAGPTTTRLMAEMGADAADIGLTVHPHPTLSETIAFAAEAMDGTLTDLYMPKKR